MLLKLIKTALNGFYNNFIIFLTPQKSAFNLLNRNEIELTMPKY